MGARVEDALDVVVAVGRHAGQGDAAGRIYVIQPNDGNTWDMSILNAGGVKVSGSPSNGSGMQNRMRYVPALRGIVLLARSSANLYFMRTA